MSGSGRWLAVWVAAVCMCSWAWAASEGSGKSSPKKEQGKSAQRAETVTKTGAKSGKSGKATEASKQEAKQKAEAAGEQARKQQEEGKARREEAARQRQEQLSAKREELGKAAGERVDKRQENQSKRIEHGVNKGYLTDDELKQLQSQQDRIAEMESGLKSDGHLSREDFKSLRDELNAASRAIWAQKHDTEGKQMPAYALGRNVFAKDEWTSQLQNGSLSNEQARAITGEFREMISLKRKLSSENLTTQQRTEANKRYNDLLNKYFVVR